MAVTAAAVQPITSIVDINGDPVSGGKLKFFETGSSTPKDVWTTSDQQVSTNVTEVSLDPTGMPSIQVYGNGFYKVELFDSNDDLVRTYEDIQYIIAASIGGDILPIDPVTGLPTDLAANLGSALFRFDEAHINQGILDTLSVGGTDIQTIIDDTVDAAIDTAVDNLPIYGDFEPLDETTKVPTDLAGALGTASFRWNACDIGTSTDDAVFGGQTLTQLLEDNMFDSIASKVIQFRQLILLLGNTDFINTTFLTTSESKTIRVYIYGASSITDAGRRFQVTVDSQVREYRPSDGQTSITDFFDISGIAPSTNINIQIRWIATPAGSSATISGGFYTNAF